LPTANCLIFAQHSALFFLPTADYLPGDLTNTDNVMNNTFWIGVQPALTHEMLEFAANTIESYFGVKCL